MKVLLTGFDPFGGESVNPAFEAIKLLPDTIAGAEIVKVEIPTEFTRSISSKSTIRTLSSMSDRQADAHA